MGDSAVVARPSLARRNARWQLGCQLARRISHTGSDVAARLCARLSDLASRAPTLDCPGAWQAVGGRPCARAIRPDRGAAGGSAAPELTCVVGPSGAECAAGRVCGLAGRSARIPARRPDGLRCSVVGGRAGGVGATRSDGDACGPASCSVSSPGGFRDGVGNAGTRRRRRPARAAARRAARAPHGRPRALDSAATRRSDLAGRASCVARRRRSAVGKGRGNAVAPHPSGAPERTGVAARVHRDARPRPVRPPAASSRPRWRASAADNNSEALCAGSRQHAAAGSRRAGCGRPWECTFWGWHRRFPPWPPSPPPLPRRTRRSRPG